MDAVEGYPVVDDMADEVMVGGDAISAVPASAVPAGVVPASAHPAGGDASVTVAVRRLDPGLPLPSYAHDGDAGADLYAATDVELPPGGRALVPTGLAVALPRGYVGLIHPRSGLAHRLGVTVLNAPGTVDAGYRGEIKINLINHDPVTPAKITRGDRIAQLVIQQVARARFQPVDDLPGSVRGDGGHGSTGGHSVLGPRVGE